MERNRKILLALVFTDTTTTVVQIYFIHFIFCFVNNSLQVIARISILMSIFGAFAKLQKSTVSSVMSVGVPIARPSFLPSAWNNSALTKRIFMKFYIGAFY